VTRRRAVLVALAGAVAILGLTGTVWVRADTRTAVATAVPVAVTGLDAAPGATAAGLLVAAAALAMAIGRRWGTPVAAAAIGLGGLLAAASAWSVVRAPEVPALAAARHAVGVGVLEDAATVTVAPWLVIATGLVVVAHAAWAAVAARRWPAPGGRHEVTGRGPGDRPVDDWDALSGGRDPSA